MLALAVAIVVVTVPSAHSRRAIAFELAFAAALIYLPPLQHIHTAALGLPELALPASFPVIVWGSDQLRRAWRRRHDPTR